LNHFEIYLIEDFLKKYLPNTKIMLKKNPIIVPVRTIDLLLGLEISSGIKGGSIKDKR